MSKSGPFSSTMSLEDHFPEVRNGAGRGDGSIRSHGRKGGKNRNQPTAKGHKYNGQGDGSSQSSEEYTPPPPENKEEKENQAEPEFSEDPDPSTEFESEQNLIKPIGIESDLPLPTVFDITSPEQKGVTQVGDTTEDIYLTANNSAEESINNVFESLPQSVDSKSDEGRHDSNTSTSGGTLTPNTSLLEDEKTLNDDEDDSKPEDQKVPANLSLPLNETEAYDDDDELGLTNASLAVQFSDTAADPLALQSFNTSLLDSSLLSSSRSAPPDLPTISEQEPQNHLLSSVQNANPIYPMNFQTSTPILSNSAPSRRSRAEQEMNFTGEYPSSIYPVGEVSTTIEQEDDPTHVARANRGYLGAEDFGSFGVTKESGICDMSTPTDGFKNTAEQDDDMDADAGISVEGVKEEVVVKSPAVTSNVEAPPVKKLDESKDSEVSPKVPADTETDAPLSEVDKEVEEINRPFLLPSTVTELTASNGVKVYVVGTAHFSKQSQLDVVQTLEKVQPSIVVLELCHSRSGMLAMNEEEIMKEAADMSLAKISATIRQTGPVQGLLHVLLLQMTASLTKKLGMAPGGEFRVAVQEAQKIPGCLIHFGDRQLSITLNRALAGLGFFQKIQLAWHFMKSSNTDITKEEVEACKEKDLLEKLLVEMAGEFPSITKVLLDERDLYLANSLWLAATSIRMDRAGNTRPNTQPIVGVVGMGHVAGIVKNWGPADPDKMEEIVVIPATPLSHVIIAKSIKICFYGLTGYMLYKGSRKLFGFPSDSLMSSVLGKTTTTFEKISSKVMRK